MNLHEIKQTLAAEELQLTKSLGQNFLHDQNQLKRIIAAADLHPHDQILEIGPGLGPLTELLLAKAGHVLALEKDHRLVVYLQKRWPGPTHLDLRHEDALDFLRHARPDLSSWKVVSNLPYSVASPILVELAQAEKRPARIVATLQWEVARRIAAKTDDDDYGILTLLLQLRYSVHSTFKIPAACFYPPPEVDSACVVLIRRDPPLLGFADEKLFDALVKRSFAQRRKMMFKLLKSDVHLEGTPSLDSFGVTLQALQDAWENLQLPAQIRAEKLSLDQFVRLASTLSTATQR